VPRAAYVPIDPQYSSEWLKFILEDTGAPIGVEITHRALANFASEAARIFEIQSSDRVLQ
jgi:hypothetical protein